MFHSGRNRVWDKYWRHPARQSQGTFHQNHIIIHILLRDA
jgi:hypothetical protein